MAIELKQHLKLTQQLVMTPQLQQAIKLLQLSRIELINTIQKELEQNPVLEEADSEPSAGDTSVETETEKETQEIPTLTASEDEETPWEKKAIEEEEWKAYWEDDSRRMIPSYSFEEREQPNFENLLTKKPDLVDHLLWQLQMSDMTEEERTIGYHIIGNLDSSGYLKAGVEEIAQELKVSPAMVETVLRKIQLFDPVGVAARDLRECLLVQTKYLGIDDPLVHDLIAHHLHNIEKRNYKEISKATGRSLEEIAQAIEVIKGLDPRPGNSYSSEEIHYIVPDIYIYKVDDEYVIQLNDDDLPRVRINPFYKSAIDGNASSPDVKDFIQEKYKSAVWLLKSIEQRQKTIYKVTKSIVKFQREFLDKGIEYLKPLILKDVADDVGIHESTVSRVTANKYAQTPQGLFELKFFFSASLKKQNGEDIATKIIKEKIRSIIQQENPVKPYSDKQIVDILGKEGIKIARRTVAKYRELMGILPSSRRKRPLTSQIKKHGGTHAH